MYLLQNRCTPSTKFYLELNHVNHSKGKASTAKQTCMGSPLSLKGKERELSLCLANLPVNRTSLPPSCNSSPVGPLRHLNWSLLGSTAKSTCMGSLLGLKWNSSCVLILSFWCLPCQLGPLSVPSYKSFPVGPLTWP